MAYYLDDNFLKQFRGIVNNSLINVLDSDPGDNDEFDEPKIIQHSSYYNFENLTSVLGKNKNNFSIFSTNIQSINAKIDELRIFVERLKQQNYVFSAICLQESWLTEDTDFSQIHWMVINLYNKADHAALKGAL